MPSVTTSAFLRLQGLLISLPPARVELTTDHIGTTVMQHLTLVDAGTRGKIDTRSRIPRTLASLHRRTALVVEQVRQEEEQALVLGLAPVTQRQTPAGPARLAPAAAWVQAVAGAAVLLQAAALRAAVGEPREPLHMIASRLLSVMAAVSKMLPAVVALAAAAPSEILEALGVRHRQQCQVLACLVHLAALSRIPEVPPPLHSAQQSRKPVAGAAWMRRPRKVAWLAWSHSLRSCISNRISPRLRTTSRVLKCTSYVLFPKLLV
mmetsp:Transcript_18282/g.33299  ORF Transcript_18282/g.33299 Transcript_18282/m.33299 type:complete len:264 (-) Transcript_18282:86-877(-)